MRLKKQTAESSRIFFGFYFESKVEMESMSVRLLLSTYNMLLLITMVAGTSIDTTTDIFSVKF